MDAVPEGRAATFAGPVAAPLGQEVALGRYRRVSQTTTRGMPNVPAFEQMVRALCARSVTVLEAHIGRA